MPQITARTLTLLTVLFIALLAIGLVGIAYLGQAEAIGNKSGTSLWSGMMPNGSMMGNGSWATLASITPVTAQAVTMTNQDAFAPQVIRVSSGTTVTWTNTDTDTHTLTFMPGMMHSTEVAGGGQFRVTFTTAGTYDYLCLYHQGMIGQVVVTA